MTSDRRVVTKSAKRSGQARVKSSPAAEQSTAQPVALLTSTLDVRPFNEDARRQLIAEAAYYRAARRSFEAGGEVEDWLAAEADVDARLCGDIRNS